jgi:ABC-type Fe3+ transport system permease subunit
MVPVRAPAASSDASHCSHSRPVPSFIASEETGAGAALLRVLISILLVWASNLRSHRAAKWVDM